MRISGKLERYSASKEPKAKYYIIPEGDNTEIKYFCGIKDNREELRIKPIIEIIPIENDETEIGHSHPKKKIENFNDDLNNEKFLFDKDIDKICFIIDRDPKNFKKEQLDDFIKECKNFGYNVFLSNPTFELFLLMHDNKIFDIDKEELLKNKKVSNNKRFLEIKLSEIFGCNKRNLRFNLFKEKIKTAIKNEKQFCEDLEKLKTELGSNVGKLIESMIEK